MVDYFESQCRAIDAASRPTCPCEELDPSAEFAEHVSGHGVDGMCKAWVSNLSDDDAAALAQEWRESGIKATAKPDTDGTWYVEGRVSWARRVRK